MMYPFMTLDDNAEIVHSEMGKDGRVHRKTRRKGRLPSGDMLFTLLYMGRYIRFFR